MAKIVRPNKDMPIFGSGAIAADLKIFGDVTESTDITLLLTNANATDGWASGVDANGFPALSWFNAIGHTFSYLTAYYLQNGIAEYVALQEYFIGSQCIGSDGFQYTSKTDNNIGNTPVGDTTNWKLSFLDSANTVVYTPTANYHPATKKYVDDVAGGKILQVVSTTKDDTFTTSSTSFVDITGFSAVITPSSTSSKILVMVECYLSNTGAASRAYINLDRNGTSIGKGVVAGSRTTCFSFFRSSSVDDMDNAGGKFLDSPASVAALTYKLQLQAEANTACLNRDGSDADTAVRPRVISTITLMEIGA